MKCNVQLEKGFNIKEIINKPVSAKYGFSEVRRVIGKIVGYDEITGVAEMEIDYEILSNLEWKPIVGQDVGILSKKSK